MSLTCHYYSHCCNKWFGAFSIISFNYFLVINSQVWNYWVKNMYFVMALNTYYHVICKRTGQFIKPQTTLRVPVFVSILKSNFTSKGPKYFPVASFAIPQLFPNEKTVNFKLHLDSWINILNIWGVGKHVHTPTRKVIEIRVKKISRYIPHKKITWFKTLKRFMLPEKSVS